MGPQAQPILSFSRLRRRRWILLLAALGASGYAAYRLYHSPAVAARRRRLLRLAASLLSAAELVSDSAETLSLVSADLRRFLRSESDEIPDSLKQISKLAQSDEVSEALVRITEALTVGVLRGYNRNSIPTADHAAGSPDFTDRVLDRVLSPAGSGFASVVVGSFARNLVLGFYSRNSSSATGSSAAPATGAPDWVDIICGSKCRELVGHCIQLFVSNAVAVYLDKTMQINTYDELFSGMTNPKHESRVRDVIVSVCNGAVETLVKTSHQVLTTNDNARESNSMNLIRSSVFTNGETGKLDELNLVGQCKGLMRRKSVDEIQEDVGWVNMVSSTLAVPRNRRFVLDVTGRVTFETVRSFLDFAMWRVSEVVRKSMGVVNKETVGKGMEVLRYASAKSVLILTLCLAICLHLWTGARVLAAA